MSKVSELRYEYAYLSDSASPPQSPLEDYQFSYAQGLMGGYGSVQFSIQVGTVIPTLYIPNGAAVLLQVDYPGATNYFAALNIINGTATVPWQYPTIPTRQQVVLPCLPGQIIQTPLEWNAASQGVGDTPTSVQLCLVSVPQPSQTNPVLPAVQMSIATLNGALPPTGLGAPITGKVCWYY